MSEEKKMILEMLKDNKISVEEAEKLIFEVGDEKTKSDNNKVKSDIKKFLRIRVTDDSETKVNVNIPIALAEVGLKMIPKDKMNVKGHNINIDDILKMIEEGAQGELVDIDVDDKGKNVKIKIYID